MGHVNDSEHLKLMKSDHTQSPSIALTLQVNEDHPKLLSLLALAAGAAAMPQTSNADIIYTPSGVTIRWEGDQVFLTPNLPGNVQLGFNARRSGTFTFTSSRFITGGARGSGYLRMRLALVTQPLVWDQIAGNLAPNASFGWATSAHNSGGFAPGYLAFEFRDSTQTGSPMRYGWVGLSMANGNLSTGNDFPRLTISGWAYDNSGAQIPMGATATVPEPSAMALLALGALTLGAKGLRSWRRDRASASRS
jgi:hypothetical protein